MDSTLALTTVTYNDRFTLPKVVTAFFNGTNVPAETKWYMVLQNCSDDFANEIIELCKDKITLVMIRFAKNIGLSKAMTYVIEQTKYFKYILNIEDDWILLPCQRKDKDWLTTCVSFMEEQKHTSTIFLRAYANDKEKKQYGWTRHIGYVNHCFPDNFNYCQKMKEANTTIEHKNNDFALIPKFLFTFNPCLVRNEDYHKCVYPLRQYSQDQKDPNHNGQWGYCEALAMEKTRHLYTYWFNEGIFGHHEDWFPEEIA